jgi:hypothetical protein
MPVSLIRCFADFVYAEVSTFVHACEGDAVTKLTNEKVPYFNAPIYLQNKTQIGKVDEIFGPINESVSASALLISLALVDRARILTCFLVLMGIRPQSLEQGHLVYLYCFAGASSLQLRF